MSHLSDFINCWSKSPIESLSLSEQFVQKSLELIEAQVVVPQPLTADQEATLVNMWQQSLGHPFDIRIVYPREIPRAAGGKYEEFRSEVP